MKLLEYYLTFGKRYGSKGGGTPDYLTARKLRMEAKRKRLRTLKCLALKKSDSISCMRDTEMLYKRVDLSVKEIEAQRRRKLKKLSKKLANEEELKLDNEKHEKIKVLQGKLVVFACFLNYS